MGKPINTKPSGCVTTSSNCVVWQGPDIAFLDLCTGDTISTVIAGIADNICLLLNYTNVNNYDTSEISATSAPDYITLLQLIIDQVAALKDVSPSSTEVTACCPDEFQVDVNAYFQGAPEFLDPTVSLVAYVNSIADVVKEHAAIITSQQTTIASLQATVNGLQTQINALM